MKLAKKKWYLFIIALIIIFDQISKLFIRTNFKLYEQLDIVKGFIKIIYVKNTGVVWGLFQNSRNNLVPLIITALSIVALITVIYIFLKTSDSCKLELISLSFITGGAVGNIIDRTMQGFVVDFIDVYVKTYHWPTFNVADSFISVGIILLLISVLRNKCVNIK